MYKRLYEVSPGDIAGTITFFIIVVGCIILPFEAVTVTDHRFE